MHRRLVAGPNRFTLFCCLASSLSTQYRAFKYKGTKNVENEISNINVSIASLDKDLKQKGKSCAKVSEPSRKPRLPLKIVRE
jgi:hypothetical protein